MTVEVAFDHFDNKWRYDDDDEFIDYTEPHGVC